MSVMRMGGAARRGRRPRGIVRRLGLDRNPLRRPVDRVETAIRLGLAAAFLLAAPWTAAVASRHARTSGLHALQEQAARYRVTATLVEDSPPISANVHAARPETMTKARWTAPDGSARTGDISVPWGRRAGAATTIWIDAAGHPADPPLRRAQLPGREVAAAACSCVVLALTVLLLDQAARYVLQRRRMAWWEAGWAEIEPRWTGRRRHP